MQILINIDGKLYEIIKNPKKLETMYHAGRVCEAMRNGTPLDKIKAEIENFEINGHIRDVECFNAGIKHALAVIDKYCENKE